MDVEIVGFEFAVEAELRAWMTQRIEKIASRFGPVDHARIEIRRATAWSSVQWALGMQVADRRTSRAVGLLEALMCRGCGHVEWFVSDPGRISPKQDHVTVVKAKPPEPDPYR